MSTEVTRDLVSCFGSHAKLEQAIEEAESQLSDVLDMMQNDKHVTVLHASSETVFANDEFHYIIKYFVETSPKQE